MRIRDIADAPVAVASLAADSWSTTGTELVAVATGIDGVAVLPRWEGASSDSMRGRLASSSGRIRTLGGTADTVSGVLDGHCGFLTVPQAIVNATITAAETAGMTVHGNGLVTSGRKSLAGVGMLVLDTLPGVGTATDAAETAFTVTLRTAMAAVAGMDVAAAAAITAAALVDAGGQGTPGVVSPGVRGKSAKSPDGIPDGVRIDRALDASLTPEGREKVLEIADEAIRELLAHGQDPAEIGVEISMDGGKLGVTLGNIDTADKITTVVSGTGSGGMSGLKDGAAFAGRFTGPGQATVVWREWSPPSNLFGAAVSGRAEAAGSTLRAHQSALRQRNPDAELSVVGHSYGTRVIDEAAGDAILALEADQIHLMGSPGMTAGSADDLNLRALDGDAEVHVYKKSGDMIGIMADEPQLHGDDPADRDWGADYVNGKDPGDRSLWDRAKDALGPVGELVDDGEDLAGSLWGLFDGDLGDEHSSYKTDENVLEALRK